MKQRAVFIDQDNLLIQHPLSVEAHRLRLMPGAAEMLTKLHAANYQIVVLAEQPSVAHGHFPEKALEVAEARLRDLLARAAGVPLTGYYYCPHHPDGVVPAYTTLCFCRKPAAGLFLQAAKEQGIDLQQSWLVGTLLDDIEAGRRAGCRTVLLLNGDEMAWDILPQRLPHYLAANFREVAYMVASVDRPVAAKAIDLSGLLSAFKPNCPISSVPPLAA